MDRRCALLLHTHFIGASLEGTWRTFSAVWPRPSKLTITFPTDGITGGIVCTWTRVLTSWTICSFRTLYRKTQDIIITFRTTLASLGRTQFFPILRCRPMQGNLTPDSKGINYVFNWPRFRITGVWILDSKPFFVDRNSWIPLTWGDQTHDVRKHYAKVKRWNLPPPLSMRVQTMIFRWTAESGLIAINMVAASCRHKRGVPLGSFHRGMHAPPVLSTEFEYHMSARKFLLLPEKLAFFIL